MLNRLNKHIETDFVEASLIEEANMSTVAKHALRRGLEARETPASSGVSSDFIDSIYDARLKPLMAHGKFDTRINIDEWEKLMMELLAFSSYAKQAKYGVGTWEHNPKVSHAGQKLTPDFLVKETARYVEIYSPAQGHGQPNVNYMANLDRQSITKRIKEKATKYAGLQIDILTHLSTVEFPDDYVKAIKNVIPSSGQRFLLFHGDREIEVE